MFGLIAVLICLGSNISGWSLSIGFWGESIMLISIGVEFDYLLGTVFAWDRR